MRIEHEIQINREPPNVQRQRRRDAPVMHKQRKSRQ
jgi:hypothetical protein